MCESQNSSISRRSAGGVAARIRQIFYISLANFVFPLIFNIAQIICITTDRAPTTGTTLLMVNNYVTVIGVLFATLWFSGSEWVRTRNELLPDHIVFSPKPNLGIDPDTRGKSGSGVVVIGKGPIATCTTGLGTGADSTALVAENKYILV
ncbi:hypothetical protein PISMIDRAFT_444767 [Pisolithus microcarpus 441]|uniref:Uncharacterized protein n=1 Tax=Pisolithus microcarpus 441 TaxID=765257 RepID=A0A0C9ZV11_9AGAM|nr:hypothetical protein PISMIDRAFT_444767 [Pisolithus microcarpus 441]